MFILVHSSIWCFHLNLLERAKTFDRMSILFLSLRHVKRLNPYEGTCGYRDSLSLIKYLERA